MQSIVINTVATLLLHTFNKDTHAPLLNALSYYIIVYNCLDTSIKLFFHPIKCQQIIVPGKKCRTRRVWTWVGPRDLVIHEGADLPRRKCNFREHLLADCKLTDREHAE